MYHEYKKKGGDNLMKLKGIEMKIIYKEAY